MRTRVVLCLLGLLAAPAFGADAPAPRPDWCRPGWVCLPSQEVAAATEEIWDLRVELAQTKAKARRFGLTVGLGGGIGGVVDDDFHVEWVPTGGAFLVWGLRF